jgi:hypothetical protein
MALREGRVAASRKSRRTDVRYFPAVLVVRVIQINLAIAWFVTDFRASPPEVSPLASNIHIEELGPEIPALSHSPNSAISGRPTPSAERTLQRLFSEYGE